MPDQHDDPELLAAAESEDALVSRILQWVRGIRFGSIEIVVHEGKVVQIERREKLRLGR